MRFRRSSTLIRWKTDTLTHENGGFRKRLPRWRLSKTDAFRISVDGRKRRKRRFSKTRCHELDNQSPTENENVSFSHSQCGRSKTIRNVRQCGRGYLYSFSLDQKRRHTKTDQCGRSLKCTQIHKTNKSFMFMYIILSQPDQASFQVIHVLNFNFISFQYSILSCQFHIVSVTLPVSTNHIYFMFHLILILIYFNIY